MIKKEKGQHILEFGTGDINIRAGWHIPEEGEKKLGLVAFRNWGKPMPIGSAETTDETVDLNEFPVFMLFSKVESIDAVINSLMDAKAYMQE